MAIQTIYTLVDNAKLETCKKGKPVPPLQIPLLRNNYLGEYRTLVERDKVLKNLGILGATGKYTYPSDEEVDSYKDIQTVLQALDYCIKLIQSYEASDRNIKQLLNDVKAIKASVTELETNTDKNTSDIEAINKQIAEFDEKLKELNVDDKITNRLNQHLENSKTIELVEDTLEVKNSLEENNAIQVKDDGIYVLDNSALVEANTKALENLSNSDKYITNTSGTSPYTVGGITEGTTAESLNGKSISDILDLMLFPTYVRDLIYPILSYSYIASLVEVGSSVIKPDLTFIQNDAGAKTTTTESILHNGAEYTSATYDSIGSYSYKATVAYEAGEYLTDNKGQVTTTRVEAGTISTTTSTIATYPWYAGNKTSVYKLDLIAFNTNSGTQDISLSGQAVIKLPGSNTLLLSFKVDGGLGYLDIDLDGWTKSTELINGITYKVWTKNDSYSSVLPHLLQFKLAL